MPTLSKESNPQGHALQAVLSCLNASRLNPDIPPPRLEDDVAAFLAPDVAAMSSEATFLQDDRRRVAARARTAPQDVSGFLAWFDALDATGPGQHDPLFNFLADEADIEQMRWFLRQEVAGEAGFEDLVALTQIKMPVRAKLELARNYWDEMGRGRAVGMHGPMLTLLAEQLELGDSAPSDLVWESVALGNLLVGLAYNRQYAYHSIGALGAIELTAPSRATKLVEGLDRLGVPAEASLYFRLHATIDIVHARRWKDEVMAPLIEASPHLAVYMAEGALMRLNAGARCFDRYRKEFRLPGSQAVPS